VLLAGAGFMVRSLLMLYNLNLNVDTAPLVVAQVALPSRDYPDGEARVDFFRRAEERLAALAEVDAMAFTTNLPGGGGAPRQLTRDGDPLAGGETRPIVTSLGVSPGYFDTLGLSLVRGRAFTPMDGDPGYENAIVNQRLAAVYFRGREPIGQRIRFEPEPGADETPPWLTIVGIAPDVRQLAQETEIGPVVYVPHRMQNGFGAMLVARSRAPLAPLSVALRSAMGEVDPDLPLYDVQTLNQFLDGQRWAYRVFGSALAIFAFIALVLSAVGLYAITAYSVTQRTPEVGIRMALGAQPPQIWWMFLRRSLVQTGIGLVLGLAGAAGVGRLLQSLLIRIGPSDPVTLVSIGLLLAAVAAAAFVWPVRRAIRIDPVSALRYE
jgi:putative ABC transport system permease protein